MNILLWILQVLLALHTATGALWKFSHTAVETMPSLGAIPNAVWLAMGVLELISGVGLIFPVLKKQSLVKLPTVAAIFVAAEMLLFTVLHISSGDTNCGPIGYWLVVAALSTFVAYGRWKLKPHGN